MGRTGVSGLGRFDQLLDLRLMKSLGWGRCGSCGFGGWVGRCR